MGGDAFAEGCVRNVVVSVHRGSPIIRAPQESHRNLRGMPGTFPCLSSGLSSDHKLLTRFFFFCNCCGMKLFGLCVMALGICNRNMWKF